VTAGLRAEAHSGFSDLDSFFGSSLSLVIPLNMLQLSLDQRFSFSLAASIEIAMLCVFPGMEHLKVNLLDLAYEEKGVLL